MEVKLGFKQTEVGVIPEDWEVKTLGEIGGVRMCKRVLKHQTREHGDVPFYKIGTFDSVADAFISRALFDEFKRKYSFPKKGDVLISAAGTIGRAVVYDGEPAYFQDSNIVWIENDESRTTNAYLWHRYQVTKWAVSHGGTVARLYNDNLRTKIYVPVPPLAEQEAIAGALSDADALIESLEQLIAKKRLVKQGAMQELLTGKRRLPGFSGEWEEKRLGAYLKFQVGFPFSSLYFNEEDQGVRLVKNRDLKSDDQVFYYSGSYNNEYVVNNGDVLVGMDGEFIPCLWGKGMALLNQRVGRILTLPGLDRLFAYYYLIKPLQEIETVTSSTTVKHLSHGDIEDIIHPLPSINEQSAIASVLSDMDAEIAALEEKLAKARLVKQGMMQELLTGRKRLV